MSDEVTKTASISLANLLPMVESQLGESLKEGADSGKMANFIDMMLKLDQKTLAEVVKLEIVKSNLLVLPASLLYRFSLCSDLKEKSPEEIQCIADMTVDLDHPKAFQLIDRRGAALHIVGRFEEAVDCFNYAIEHFKASSQILFRRAEAKYKMELYIAAKEDYEASLYLSKHEGEKFSLPPELLEKIQLNLETCKEAEATYLKVLEQDPSHYDARRRIAKVYSQHSTSPGNIEKGINFLCEAIKLEPERVEGHLDLAKSYYKLIICIGGDNRFAFDSSTYHRKPTIISSGVSIDQRIEGYARHAIRELEWILEKDGNHLEAISLVGQISKVLGDIHHRSEVKLAPPVPFLQRAHETADKLAKENSMMTDVLFKISQILIKYKTLSPEDQHFQTQFIQQLFNKLFANNARYKSEHRRLLYRCLSDFYAGIGKVEIAINVVKKLHQVEMIHGVNSTAYTEPLSEQYQALIQTSKLHPSYDSYMESLEFLEMAVEEKPQVTDHLICAAINMALADLCGSEPSKERNGYEKKSLEHCDQALEIDGTSEMAQLVKVDILLAQNAVEDAQQSFKKISTYGKESLAYKEREARLKQHGANS